MTSIHQIPYEDIELFLLTNDIDPYQDINVNYDIAMKLIKNTDTNFEIDSIVEWMIAHNLTVLKYNIPKYNKSEVLEMDNIELFKLAKSLTMQNNKLDNILNILNYLGKLKDDTKNNIFVGDPFLKFSTQSDIIFETLKNLEIDDIINFCESSNQINKSCTSPKIINLIRSELQKFDDLNLSTYNLKELLLFNSIRKFKKRNNLTEENDLSNIINRLNNIKYNFLQVDKIANIIKLDHKFVIITVTGNCYIWNDITKEEPIKINNIYGIIQVINKYDITWYLTNNGEVYLSYSGKIISDDLIKIKNNVIDYKVKNLHNIIELRNINGFSAFSSSEKNYYLNIIDQPNDDKRFILK